MAGDTQLLMHVLKSIAKQAVDSGSPMGCTVGKVVSEEYKPLEIKVEAFADVLKEQDLYLTNAVKDHWLDIETYWETVDDNDLSEFQVNHFANIAIQNSNVESYNSHAHLGNLGSPTSATSSAMKKETPHHTSHLHNIQGRKRIRVYNGLHKGESVLLLRCPGGQQYIVIDRLSPHIVGGEWQTHGGAVTDNQETEPFAVTDAATLSGWKEGAKDESGWPRFSKPSAYSPGGSAPE